MVANRKMEAVSGMAHIMKPSIEKSTNYSMVFDKISVRRDIDMCKNQYKMTHMPEFLIRAAVLKGIYVAIGGKKGIILNRNLDFVASSAKYVFDVIINDRKTQNKQLNAIINTSGISNSEIATLITNVAFSNHIETVELNRHSLYNVTYNIINEYNNSSSERLG